MATEKNMYETYFEWWLEELKKAGLVLEYEREPQTFVVHDTVLGFYNQHFAKKQPIIRDFTLVDSITYTPDYKVVFSEKLFNKLFGMIDSNKMLVEYEPLDKGNYYQETLFYCTELGREFDKYTIYFDVKPPAKAIQFSGKLGSSRDFPLKRAMLFQKENLIMNKVVPVGSKMSLFNKTFMPKRYRYTDGGTTLRKIKGNFATIEDWLLEKQIKL